jgi:3-oxoacid CoA-transferase A subunit
MINKVVDIKTAIDKIKKNDTILLGGFSEVGCPLHLLYELASRSEIDGLTLVAEDMSYSGLGYTQGPEMLLNHGQLSKIIVSFLGSHKPAEKAIAEGRLELEFVPQGTLAERIRAGGAGLGGFYTPTGVGTEAADGKETRIIDGREYVFEKPLRGDVALVKAYKADRLGNAVFKLTANNFNTCMATAGKTVILVVEKLVEVGDIEPDAVNLPGVFVDYVVVEGGVMF